MPQVQPSGLDHKRVQQLLNEVKGLDDTSSRLNAISSRLVGLPYKSSPLTGSSDSPEVFTNPLKAFDCVTYVETVMALAASSSVAEFVNALRSIRYKGGRVAWRSRNHYMTGWVPNNTKAGWVRPIRGLKASVRKSRTLDAVPGLPPQRVTFRLVPRNSLLANADKIRTGDIVMFGSTRSYLDVFHVGLLIQSDKGLRVRHASRSQGGVVDQPLEDFLKKNRMSGVIVVRPAVSK